MRISDWSSDVCSSDLVSVSRVRSLTQHVVQGKISNEVRRVFISRVNKGEPLAEVARSMGVSRACYRRWAAKALLQSQNISEQSKKVLIQRLQQGEKIAVLSKEFRIPTEIGRAQV